MTVDADAKAVVLCTFAVWRVAHLLAQEDGPFDIVFTLRAKVGQGFFGSLLDCFLCLSLWIAVPFALAIATDWLDRIVVWLALSGAASVLFLATDRRATKNDEG